MPARVFPYDRVVVTPAVRPPHRLAGQVLVDNLPVRRRIVVINRRTLAYVVSTLSEPVDGTFVLRALPPQDLGDPYLVIRYDDSSGDNAQVFDRVYQVDDLGNPPT
jgi:hypothetical protein